MLIIWIHQGEKYIASGAYLEYATLALHATPSGALNSKSCSCLKA